MYPSIHSLNITFYSLCSPDNKILYECWSNHTVTLSLSETSNEIRELREALVRHTTDKRDISIPLSWVYM